MVKIRKAVVPAAGLGSRMYPFSKIESKLLIPIINKPLMAYLVEELHASGIEEVIFVSNHVVKVKQFFKEDEELDLLLKKLGKKNLIDELRKWEKMCKVQVVEQDKPLGWMHEVLHVKDKLGSEPFVVTFSDILYTGNKPAAKQVIDTFKEKKKNIRGEGRFVLKPVVFDILEHEKFKLGEDVVDFDVFGRLREKKDLFDYNIKGEFHDVGNPLSYLKTTTLFGLHDKETKKEYRRFLKNLLK